MVGEIVLLQIDSKFGQYMPPVACCFLDCVLVAPLLQLVFEKKRLGLILVTEEQCIRSLGFVGLDARRDENHLASQLIVGQLRSYIGEVIHKILTCPIL